MAKCEPAASVGVETHAKENNPSLSESAFPIEPHAAILPDVVIASRAESDLKKIGLSDGLIEGLKGLMSDLRYDQCMEKVLSWRGPIFFDEKGKTAQISNFDDITTGRGQCGTLSLCLLDRACKSGWLKEANRFLREQGKRQLDLCYCNGQSPEFFVSKRANHVWLELREKTTVTWGKQIRLVLDPSFRAITTRDGYQLREMSVNPVNLERPMERRFELVPVEIDGTQWSITCSKLDTIGISDDWQLTFGLAFFFLEGRPHPIVSAGNRAGDAVTLLRYPITGQYNLSQSPVELSNHHYEKMKNILEQVRSMEVKQVEEISLMPSSNQFVEGCRQAYETRGRRQSKRRRNARRSL